MTRKRRPAPPRPKGVMAGWTVSRATVTGIALGLAALLAGILLRSWPDLLYPYAALLLLTLFCGASILWITLWDMRTRGRGGRMRPIRAFDAAMGAALVLPAGYGLWLIAPYLGLRG
ncbi:MAG TPA: hypothetical protein VEX35_15385 [Allosphingosinicella sp.]|nr:hypothetical protein [Allosphingosinicella sp.]